MVMESVDLELISAAIARAPADPLTISALVRKMVATVLIAGPNHSTASVPQGHIRAAIVNPPVIRWANAPTIIAMESQSPAQISMIRERESVRRAIIGDVPASRPAILMTRVRAAQTHVVASILPEMPMESFRMEFAPEALTGDVTVHPLVVLATMPAIGMDVVGSMLPMEVWDFVPMGTIMDVRVTRFAHCGETVHARIVEDRTEFAPRGIMLAATVIISSLTILEIDICHREKSEVRGWFQSADSL